MAPSRVLVSLIMLLFVFHLHPSSASSLSNASSSSSSLCSSHDRSALLAFKQASSLIIDRWVGEGCCNWPGVKCNISSGRVTHLQLAKLQYAADLNFYSKEDNVSLSQLCRLSELQVLNVSSAADPPDPYGVTIPPCIFCSLPKLVRLVLFTSDGYSYFQGQLPSCLGSLQQLTHLVVAWVTGEIPPSVCTLQRLTFLDLIGQFTGHIPGCLSKLQQLTHLSLDGAFTTGGIPASVCSLQRLTYLSLQGGFKGEIPPCISKLQHLTQLVLFNTGLTGEIPPSLCTLERLTILELDGAFTGGIPACFSKLQNLTQFSLSNAQLTGEISPSLCTLQRLTYLYWHRSSAATLPACLCKLQQLNSLIIVSGSIHEEYFSCLSSSTGLQLSSLDLFSARVVRSASPPRPIHLSNLSNLQWLGLDFSTANWTSYSFVPTGLTVSLVPTGPALSLHALCALTRLSYLELTNIATEEGRIPDCIGDLLNLTQLVLNPKNSLSGTMPPSLSKLPNLSHLDLSHNSLEGSIPTQWENLTYLDLSYNSFEGSIPTEWGNLSQLAYLDLSYNSFNGSMPAEWENLSQLQALVLSNNHLTIDPVPSWLFRLPSLSTLGLSSCHLPRQSFECSSLLLLNRTLGYLDLSYNNLSGDVLHCFAQNSFQQLYDLTLSGNPFDTVLPTRFRGFSAVGLYLKACKLSGNLSSAFIDSLETLQYLDLSNNDLVGDISLGTTNMSSITSVDLSNNHFTGVAPSVSLPHLAYLWVSNNSLNGDVSLLLGMLGGGTTPDALCNGETSWTTLDFSHNALTGFLPSALGRCSWLQGLYFANNRLHGEIPPQFGNLSLLQTLSLPNNNLTGEIPQTLSNCSSLVVLDLSHNRLRGNLQHSGVSNLSDLRVLALGSNRFHGSIPAWIGNFSQVLQVIDLSNNNFSGTVPEDLQLPEFRNTSAPNNTGNALEQLGTVYQESIQLNVKGQDYVYTYVLTTMIALDLSGNHLTGGIPSQLGDLYAMVFLNLSRNLFTGPIPESLSNLINLESLDLSYNSLEGSIPDQFANLTALEYFNVSYNPHLSGKIPTGGQFLTFSSDCYKGDSSLCGEPILEECPGPSPPLALPPPPKKESKPNGFSRFVGDWFSIPAIIVGYTVTLVATLWIIAIWKPSLMIPPRH